MGVVLRQAQHDILALPDVTTLTVGLLVGRHAGQCAVGAHVAKDLINSILEYLLEFRVAVVGVEHGTAAYCLGPHLTDSEIGTLTVAVESHQAIVRHHALVPVFDAVTYVVIKITY